MDYSFYFEANKQLWNERTKIHVRSEFYDVSSFKQGKSSLNKIELQEFGSIQNKNIVHLQCHFGMDSLSLQELGAHVTGVDLSSEAIIQAKQLAKERQLNTQFVEHEVYGVSKVLKQQFDIVFTSYGVLGWLPSMQLWAKEVAELLLPGGALHLVEFHPFLYALNESENALKYNYFYEESPEETVVEYSYDGSGEKHEPKKEFWWCHSLSDVISSLLAAGLQLEFIREHDYSPYPLGPNYSLRAPGEYTRKELTTSFPYLFSLKATKPL